MKYYFAILTSALFLTTVISTPAYAADPDDIIKTTPRGKKARFDSPDGRAAALSGTVQSRPVSLIFTGFDANHDRIVSRSELDAGLAREWSAMNTNFSGKVSPITFERWQISAMGSKEALPSRVTFDQDLDTMVSESEFTGLLTQIFTDMDKDTDNALSREELVFNATRRIVVKEKRTRSREDTLPRRF
ncbi:EF-hand domain-containing protein [Robiginitomaculum antarcticum]|uniref:EF-hand domain-containing protein n=1 Tax=Robiginitomaculum antarcticum TaxID=437507 RepID=UPI0012EAF189|nr:hypothetical protein [Robiginitomaculum antarcticum]